MWHTYEKGLDVVLLDVVICYAYVVYENLLRQLSLMALKVESDY